MDTTLYPPRYHQSRRRKESNLREGAAAVPSRDSSSRAASCDDEDGHYIIKIGSYLTSRYKITRLLGQGTFGRVVEVYDREMDVHRAIKIIRSVPKYRDAAKLELKILKELKRCDPSNKKRCIHLVDCFDYRNHICMVFRLLSQSVFDYLKANDFNPFPLKHVKSFAFQLLTSVKFMHSINLIHTDLKPENIMLCDVGSTQPRSSERRSRQRPRELLSTDIRLIDFGSSIFSDDHHTAIVSTRHYRAPEILLGCGWSFPCDVWSIGCILVELYTGEALFQTHENLEHLAMMQACIGPFPGYIYSLIDEESKEYFHSNGVVRYPVRDTLASSADRVAAMRPLADIVCGTDRSSRDFLDLLRQLLQIDPRERITAQQ
ncbi:MAG: hypothetical protein SGCHY_003915, partial [Lobulomycetales sp.]